MTVTREELERTPATETPAMSHISTDPQAHTYSWTPLGIDDYDDIEDLCPDGRVFEDAGLLHVGFCELARTNEVRAVYALKTKVRPFVVLLISPWLETGRRAPQNSLQVDGTFLPWEVIRDWRILRLVDDAAHDSRSSLSKFREVYNELKGGEGF